MVERMRPKPKADHLGAAQWHDGWTASGHDRHPLAISLTGQHLFEECRQSHEVTHSPNGVVTERTLQVG